MRARFVHTYEDIISMDNLLGAWKEFLKGKRGKRDVQEFEYRLSDNILALHRELAAGAYRHGGYHHFKISDPKPRDIHKASVRDRLVHHALYRQLYPFFDRAFISDSYSCRFGKGTHRAMNRFKTFAYQASKNYTRTCWVLKCDIRKFFASIDQSTLFAILRQYLSDERTLSLLRNIIESFHSTALGKGLPLGNLTSQLLVNIYLNEFDQFVKHKLKAKRYIRYADDFVILSHDRNHLLEILPCMEAFLQERLKLAFHPDKVSIETLASGIDFLGWVHFPDHRVLRTATKRRMFRRIKEMNGKPEVVASYLGLLSHGNTRRLRAQVESLILSP
jgi:RNA-directed DNA polymerase